MSLVFYKRPTELSSQFLHTLVERFASYAEEVSATGDDDEQFEQYCSKVNLLQGSIDTIVQSRNTLQNLVRELKRKFDDAKSKTSKKDLTSEIEEIESEAKYSDRIAKANELISMLGTRVNEAKNQLSKLARKLGRTNTDVDHTSSSAQNGNSTGQRHEEIGDASSYSNETTVCAQNSRFCRSVKPEQLKLPRFSGDEDEFAEFWAIYDTLVHQNNSLSTVEKMLLLKDSLKGRAEMTIKGIQLIPSNYTWMVEALKKKYGSKSINRAKIDQKLMDLPTAKNDANSCTQTFDHIRMLINHMVSAGQDIRQIQDAMWTEKILEKFPYEIVKTVLVAIQHEDEVKIDQLMDHLEKEINAQRFVESLLKHHGNSDQPTRRFQKTSSTTAPRTGRRCHFCEVLNHSSSQCRKVSDVSSRRTLIKEAKKCWKCFSCDHNSYDCQNPNCPKCGQMHDISLCFCKASESNNGSEYNTHQNNRFNTPSSVENYWYSHVVSSKAQRDARFNRSTVGKGLNGIYQRPRQKYPHRNGNSHSSCATKSQPQLDQSGEQIVLMTAEGNVWNKNTGQFEKVLFFFDTGAQKTMIMEQTASGLGLEKQGTQICTMYGIGGHIESFQTSTVSITATTTYGKEMYLSAQTKLIITNGFLSAQLGEEDKQFLEDKEVCISNQRFRGDHQIPQLLIGLDYYYDLVNAANSTVLASGLRIIPTVFGPAIHGKGSTQLQPSEEVTHSLSLLHDSKRNLQNKAKRSPLDPRYTAKVTRNTSRCIPQHLEDCHAAIMAPTSRTKQSLLSRKKRRSHHERKYSGEPSAIDAVTQSERGLDSPLPSSSKTVTWTALMCTVTLCPPTVPEYNPAEFGSGLDARRNPSASKDELCDNAASQVSENFTDNVKFTSPNCAKNLFQKYIYHSSNPSSAIEIRKDPRQLTDGQYQSTADVEDLI